MNTGQVAFITGGWEKINSVELYSPIGDCQYSLAPLPVDLQQHIMFRFEDTIMACAGIITKLSIATRWAKILLLKLSRALILPSEKPKKVLCF